MQTADPEARTRAEKIIDENLEWYHSIELAPGVVTPGRFPPEDLASELRGLRLPDLHGKSVLDIVAYDGYYSFAAERLGAAQVTALDHYAWATDNVGYMKEWRKSNATGTTIPAPPESEYWRPDELPGRRTFDAARSVLGSQVKPVVGDFMTMDLTTLGRFDVVLFLGVLYHLEEPLRAIRRLASVTAPGGLAVIETAAVEFPGIDLPVCEFFPGAELNNDASNWWAPNARALEGFCRAAGFDNVTLVAEPPWRSLGTRLSDAFWHSVYESHLPNRLGIRKTNTRVDYRAFIHARHP